MFQSAYSPREADAKAVIHMYALIMCQPIGVQRQHYLGPRCVITPCSLRHGLCYAYSRFDPFRNEEVLPHSGYQKYLFDRNIDDLDARLTFLLITVHISEPDAA
jgi:hypothetical protein